MWFPPISALLTFFKVFFYGPILKSLVDLLQYYFCFLYFDFLAMRQVGCWLLQLGDQNPSLTLEGKAFNHWTARDVSTIDILDQIILASLWIIRYSATYLTYIQWQHLPKPLTRLWHPKNSRHYNVPWGGQINPGWESLL